MIEADLDQFSEALKHLGLTFGKTIDSAQLMDAFRDVGEYPLPLVLDAIDGLRRSCRYFPRPAQLIDACRERAHTTSIDRGGIPAGVDHLAERYCCDLCHDTGFVRALVCPGDGSCHVRGCGAPDHPVAPHEYTRACLCRPTNPWLAYERTKLRRTMEEAR